MKSVFLRSQVVALAGLLVAGTAFAQQDEPEERAQEDADEEAERADELTESERIRVRTDPERDIVIVDREETAREEERPRLPFGVGVSIGGGVAGFATDEMTDVSDLGGTWEARLTAGTRSPIGMEVGYIGSAQGLEAIGLDEDAVLLGNGAEALGRVNLINESPVQPYAFGGAAYRNYRITNSDQNLSSLANSDDVFELPVGAGINFLLTEGLFLDARGTFRWAFDDDLTAPGAEGEEVGSNLNSWGGTLRLGYEF